MTNNYIAQRENDIQKISKDLKKIGHIEILEKIQKTSRNALCDFPTDKDISKLPPREKRVVNRIRDVLQAGCECSEWGEPQLVEFLNDVSWGVAVADAVTAFMMLDNNDGGGGNMSCSTKCRKVYDKCVNDEGCDTDCWICLCESTCSLEYTACMARCLVGGFHGSSGIFAI